MAVKQRARPTRRSAGIAATLLFVAYVLWNLVAWGNQPAQETFDTYRYFGDWGWNLGAIFEPLNGGFAASLLYVIAPNPTLISLLQVVIAVVVWSLLALAIVHRLHGTWVAWALAIATLLTSLQSIFWSTHFALASESLAFSAAVMWLASIVWLTSREGTGTGPLIGLTLAMTLMAATRPQAMLALLPVQIVILTWWTRRESQTRSLRFAIPALIPIAGFALFRVWQISQHDRWPFRYALHNLVDKEPSFRAYALERMPPCEAIPAALSGPAPWNEVLALDGTMINTCPETYLWFQSNATSVWTWVPAIPGDAIRNFLDVLPGTSLIRWNEIVGLPTSVDFALMPNSNPWVFIGLCLLIGIGLAIAAGVRPVVTPLALLGVIVSVMSVLGYVFLVWAADGVDFGRHVFPVLPLLGVAALIMPSTIPGRKNS